MSKSTISVFQLFEMFPDQETARVYLESRLWPDGVRCPHCGLGERITTRKGGYYRCNQCKEDFTVRTGTIFERSHVPLHKWIFAMYLVVTARKGISSMQLAKEIGVTQKTAWFVLGRLREACGGNLDKLRGVVEIDEVHIGGLGKNMHAAEKKRKGGVPKKAIVVGMRERGGRTKAVPVPSADEATLEFAVIERVEAGSTVHTDEWRGYAGLRHLGYTHETINHKSGEYARDGVTTNSIESVWAVLQRGIYGVYGDHPGLDRHRRSILSWLRQAGASICILVILIGYGFDLIWSKAEAATKADFALDHIVVSVSDAPDAIHWRLPGIDRCSIVFCQHRSVVYLECVSLAARQWQVAIPNETEMYRSLQRERIPWRDKDGALYSEYARRAFANILSAEKDGKWDAVRIPPINLEPIYTQSRSMRSDELAAGQFRGGLRGFGSDCSIVSATSYQNQLPNKQNSLAESNEEQEQREASKISRIVSDPLRFESEFFVNKRLLLTLMFYVLGLGLGGWSGKYLNDKRYGLGASLIGFGCLCGVCGWGIGFLGWFL